MFLIFFLVLLLFFLLSLRLEIFIPQLVVVGRVLQDAGAHLVVFRTQDIVLLLVGRSLYAGKIQQQVRQGIRHHPLVLGGTYLPVDGAVFLDVFL